ncbi:MAG: hypothetical protein N4A33_08495 [Bacteriovoracaceae bacterium]|nr:hypothetical protein [Bacteriovoracaceae bacterium]
MKKLLVGLLVLGSFSVFSQAKIITHDNNKVFLTVTATGSNAEKDCNSKLDELKAKLDASNRVIIKSNESCDKEYYHELQDGVVARFNAKVIVLK